MKLTHHPKWWETASPDEIAHQQSRRLTPYLRDRVVPFVAYYRRQFKELGLDPRDIRRIDDLSLLPFTRKSHLENPRDFVVIPDEHSLKRQGSTLRKVLRHGPRNTQQRLTRELRPILLTSTTGRSAAPVPFLYTQHDLDRLEESGRRLMELCRADATWRHLNAFPFAPHLAFWQAHYAGIGYNTFVLSTGGGKSMGTEGNLRLIDKIQPDTLIAMPTFLYHLLQEAHEEGSRWTQLQRIVLGGEKVPQGMRRKIISLCQQLGSPQVRILSTYGFTEAKVAWTECLPLEPGAEPSGFHIYPDMGFIEIIDPETGERVPDGQPGEIVYTPIDARGTIVLRYRTGDLIEGGLTQEPCPYCGRTCPRLIGKISRVSDIRRLHIDKLKGTLVDFNALENLLDDTDGLGAWQIELRKKDDDPLQTDQVLVHAVTLDGTSEDQLRERIEHRIRQTTEFSPNAVTFHSWDEMRRIQGVGKELKEQKLVDHRPKPL
ncbi:phenylacetate-coenzyme A ligase PaaK-like adenylate-forming protein [Haloferula luteola]|uniref:Phenylacetate-coenzyme A ligase PaaK-like adenylate-forming protein n=1 Tax=Haloferula luteola TaxID=595692 RepID=A0A840V1V4_9BACT|nr:AMP-binding protein [Haloferula luteola]MBB5351036.1 phenylacetate-coenzyme A ligase PaaK-like adenylate-forming protein [Haloferula luteola]